MSSFEILDDGRELALVRLPRFAPTHVHAFVIRGVSGSVLFKPGPVDRVEICRAAGLKGTVLHLARQVHGASVYVPTGDPALSENTTNRDESTNSSGEALAPPEADALISSRTGHAVGVATADCLPILLALRGGPCAAVHAGWKGLLAGVIEAAIQRLREVEAPRAEFSDRLPGHGLERRLPLPMEAAIGPAIGPCCFEVGPEVADRFRARFPLEDDTTLLRSAETPGKSLIDLGEAARRVLEESGIERTSIHTVAWCTRCGASRDDSEHRPSRKDAFPAATTGRSSTYGSHRLESYRRDGPAAGRMIALITPTGTSVGSSS